MCNKIVSVIVPIYNVEAYLSRCLDSLIKQSYSNIEIILINDGSPDNCGVICDEYKKRDQRVKVIHKVNGGLSDARNAGLDIAKGEYLTFVDSDDFVHEDYILDMINACEKYGCDMAQCDFKRGHNDIFPYEQKTNGIAVFDNVEIFNGRKLKITAWGKIYKSKLFSDLRFPVGKINEDEFTTYKAVYFSKKIAILDYPLYYYYQSNNSIMRNSKKEIKLDFIKAYEERITFFSDFNEDELVLISKKELAIRAMMYYMNINNKSCEYSKLLLKICRENSNGLLFSKVPLLEKLLLRTFLLAPNLSTFFAKKLVIR